MRTMNHIIFPYLIISLVLTGIFGMASFFFYKNIFRANPSHSDAAVIDELNEIVQNNDVFNAVLLLAQEYCQDIDIEQSNKTFDKIVNEIEVRIKNKDNPREIVGIINDYLFVEYQIQSDDARVIDNLLPDKVLENRKGHCVGLSLLYVALGERLHLPLYAKTVPFHMYVCYDDGYTKFNIETTMKGFICPESYYSYHYPYPAKHQTIKKLSKHEVMGSFLNGLGHYLKQSQNVLGIQKKALLLYPDSEVIHTSTGHILWKLNKPEEAKRHLLKAIKLDPTSWQAYLGISNLYYEGGDYKQAVESYIQTINLLHKSFKILSSYQSGIPDKEKLIELAGAWLQSKGVPYENLVGGGVGLFQQEEYELSNELFAHALKMYPEELRTHVYYAMTNFHLGNYEQARKHAKIANEKNGYTTECSPAFLISTIANSYEKLGQSYALLGKYELFINSINKAIEIGGPSNRYYSSMGGAYLLKGDKTKAIEFYKKALELDPSDKQAQKQLSKLMSSRCEKH